MQSPNSQNERRFFRLASFCFLVGALFHLKGWAFPQADDHQSVARHLCFVVIDLGFALLFLTHPKWLIYVFGGFLVEQYFQHGSQIQLHFLEHGRLSIIDSLVLIVLTGIMIFLFRIWLRQRLQAGETDSERS